MDGPHSFYHLGGFYLLATVNNTPINTYMFEFILLIPPSIFLGGARLMEGLICANDQGLDWTPEATDLSLKTQAAIFLSKRSPSPPVPT